MASRGSNLEGVILSLEILKRIPRRSKITAVEIRQQLQEVGLERDLRTIQRLLEALSSHFEIERDDRSRPYGYRWKEQAQGLSLPTLSEKESILLSLAEFHLRNLLPASLMKSMAGFFRQAKARLNGQPDGKPEKAWLSKVRVVSPTLPMLPAKIKEGIFDAVSNSLYANHWLYVDYVNARGGRRNAKVMPLGIAQQGSRLFLVCRFDGYDNERSLALHRMLKAEDTGLPFTRPKNFDLQRFDDDGRFGFGDGKKIRVRMRLPLPQANLLVETPISKDQVVTVMGDQAEVIASVVESDQLIWWLRQFGSDLKLLEPRTIRGVNAEFNASDN